MAQNSRCIVVNSQVIKNFLSATEFEVERPATSALHNFGVTSSRRFTTSLTKDLGDIVGDF